MKRMTPQDKITEAGRKMLLISACLRESQNESGSYIPKPQLWAKGQIRAFSTADLAELWAGFGTSLGDIDQLASQIDDELTSIHDWVATTPNVVTLDVISHVRCLKATHATLTEMLSEFSAYRSLIESDEDSDYDDDICWVVFELRIGELEHAELDGYDAWCWIPSEDASLWETRRFATRREAYEAFHASDPMPIWCSARFEEQMHSVPRLDTRLEVSLHEVIMGFDRDGEQCMMSDEELARKSFSVVDDKPAQKLLKYIFRD